MGNPSVHDHKNLPIVAVGGRSDRGKGGRHIKYPRPTPLANLWLTVLDKMGIPQEKFGDSTGRIQEF